MSDHDGVCVFQTNVAAVRPWEVEQTTCDQGIASMMC